MLRAYQAALEWIHQGDHREKLVLAVLSSLMVALIAWLRKRIAAGLHDLFVRVKSRAPFRAELVRYREQLERDTFRIHHAWMKEGQTLGDILVPVSVESESQGDGVETLAAILAQYLGPGEVRHLVLTGGPGSGKSVALRLAARQLWVQPSFDEKNSRVPILITFSDYRNAQYQLSGAIEGSLRSRGFRPAKGPDQGVLAKEFVDKSLSEGRLVILIDALDELAIVDRVTAVQHLHSEMKEYSRTPMVLTCRSAAWHGQLRGVPYVQVRMADFSPAAIRQFVRGWGFRPPKSTTELLGVIESQPHIGTLARNPLMLTIIAFLYSQPRYRLPENRAQFYEVCSRALLEEWDQHENPMRANQYDRPHKEFLLGRLAYEHLCGLDPDKDIEETVALSSFAEGMHQLGLVRAGNASMLAEIALNSGLLVRLPPTGLRFPHQTYLEYFAAVHLLRQASPETLLNHYKSDRNRWREVVLLYCGINADVAQNSRTIASLLSTESVEIALATLIDARAVEGSIVERVLEAAEDRLSSAPNRELITGLGYLSGNPLSAYAERARDILQSILRHAAEQHLHSELIEDLLLACLRRPNETTIMLVMDKADQLDLARLLPAMGDRAIAMTTRILGQPSVTLKKKLEWIEGLRRAGAVRTLHTILTSQVDDAIQRETAVALARSSKGGEFWECLEDQEQPTPEQFFTDESFQRWSWNWSVPIGRRGKAVVFFLASQLAEALREKRILPDDLNEVERPLAFLAFSLYYERGYPTLSLQAPLDTLWQSPPGILRHTWRKVTRPRWLSWMRFAGVRYFESLFLASMIPHLIVIAWLMLATFGDFGVNSFFARIYLAIFIASATIACYLSESLDEEWMWIPVLVIPLPMFVTAGLSLLKRESLMISSLLLITFGYWLTAASIEATLFFKIAFCLVPIQVLFSSHISNWIAVPPMLSKKTADLCVWLYENFGKVGE